MKQPDKPIYVLYESFRPNYDSHLVHTFSSAHKQKSLKVIKLFPHIVRFNIPHDVHHMVIGEWGNFCFCQVLVCIQNTHHTIHSNQPAFLRMRIAFLVSQPQNSITSIELYDHNLASYALIHSFFPRSSPGRPRHCTFQQQLKLSAKWA